VSILNGVENAMRKKTGEHLEHCLVLNWAGSGQQRITVAIFFFKKTHISTVVVKTVVVYPFLC